MQMFEHASHFIHCTTLLLYFSLFVDTLVSFLCIIENNIINNTKPAEHAGLVLENNQQIYQLTAFHSSVDVRTYVPVGEV